MRLLSPAPLALPDERDQRDQRDRLLVDAALDEAFAPLRARSSDVGAARVRAAVRWTRAEPRPVRGVALLARIGELSVAAVISAFLFGASVTSIAPATDFSQDTVSTGMWMLNGRTALQRPMSSRVADARLTAGDDADNAAIVRRAAARQDLEPLPTSTIR